MSFRKDTHHGNLRGPTPPMPPLGRRPGIEGWAFLHTLNRFPWNRHDRVRRNALLLFGPMGSGKRSLAEAAAAEAGAQAGKHKDS